MRRPCGLFSHVALLIVSVLPGNSLAVDTSPPHQATGIRAGDLTDTSAVVWMRLTASPERNKDGKTFPTGNYAHVPLAVTGPTSGFEGACPGAPGRVRLRYSSHQDLREATVTAWFDVAAEQDFTHKFVLKDLRPGTTYYYQGETTGPNGQPEHGSLAGQFRTAPAANVAAPVKFCVMTCQGYPDRGHPDGHPIYPSMGALQPDFACLTGDLVYYDNDAPSATTLELARYHWQRMFSLPRIHAFTRQVGCYWLKDDHDTLKDDTWPGQTAGEFTFAEGQKLFAEQAPQGPGRNYRTYRWGRDLQVWFTDGRDFRSPNKMADGPDKSIWGAEQKAWFKQTVAESNATWKVLVSPTPLVGPDRKNKSDNHSNAVFAHEGNEIRGWLKEHVPDNFFVICGDRHWQYHSVHPETGLNEFSVGPASNEHASGTPGEDKKIHRFHRVSGGFICVTVDRLNDRPAITFSLRDVAGKPVYEWSPGKN